MKKKIKCGRTGGRESVTVRAGLVSGLQISESKCVIRGSEDGHAKECLARSVSMPTSLRSYCRIIHPDTAARLRTTSCCGGAKTGTTCVTSVRAVRRATLSSKFRNDCGRVPPVPIIGYADPAHVQTMFGSDGDSDASENGVGAAALRVVLPNGES